MGAGGGPSAAPKPPLLALEDAGKAFGRRVALRGITLGLPAGACLLLLGPNGAGKTTLLGIAAGLLRPTTGRFLVEGSARDAAARLRPRLGYLAHRTLLYDDLTARQNLTFFGRLYGIASPRARASELLETFGLARQGERPAGALSRGQQQRLALARAFVHDPDLLLLDEPYAGLDADGAQLLTATLAGLRSRGATIALATHAPDAPLELADAVAILVAGELVHHGPLSGAGPAELTRLYGRVTAST